MLLIFIIISWMLSMSFMFLKHPLSLGFIILLQTIIVSLSTGLLNLNFWYSYVLFLIMVGGMLILFIYMTSVASNEKFKFSNKLFVFQTIIILLIPMFMWADNFIPMMKFMNYDLIDQSFYMYSSLNKFMNYPNMMTMLLLMIYLFVTLIATVKITQSKLGPLRQTNF